MFKVIRYTTECGDIHYNILHNDNYNTITPECAKRTILCFSGSLSGCEEYLRNKTDEVLESIDLRFY